MKVADVMSGPVWVVRPDDDLAHARNEMISRGVKKLPVVDDRANVVGMLSLWDIAFAPDTNLARARGMSADLNRPVSEAMSRDVVSLIPQEDAKRAMRTLLHAGVQSAPVIHEHALIGIVTESDLLRSALDTNHFPTMVVGDIMTPEVVTVHRHTSLPTLLETFREHEIHQVPVEESAGVLVGMASLSNVVFGSWFDPNIPIGKRVTTVHKTTSAGRKGARHVEQVHAVVEDVMTDGLKAVEVGQGIKAAANILLHSGFNAIPVVEADVPVGVVTRRDILRALSEMPATSEVRGQHVYEGHPARTEGGRPTGARTR